MKCPIIDKNTVLRGDSIKLLKCFPDNYASAIVTDPPYNIGVPSSWDSFSSNAEYQSWTERWAKNAIRVIKPGGYALVFATPRLQHRVASGLENAGFLIKDSLDWIYATGFSKSRNVGIIMDKEACKQSLEQSLGRKATAEEFFTEWNDKCKNVVGKNVNHMKFGKGAWEMHGHMSNDYKKNGRIAIDLDLIEPSSPDGKKWRGWGMSLKPAHESIILAQKPMDGGVIANAKEWGTGPVNIGEARIPYADESDKERNTKGLQRFASAQGKQFTVTRADMSTDTFTLKGNLDGNPNGRVPSNIVLSDPLLGEYDKYFMIPKATRKEKTNGGTIANDHPTTKPLNLMSHLVKLVTRPGSIVIDPFAGSGTTLVAAKCSGRDFIGIDINTKNVSIARSRIKAGCGVAEDRS